ncbi:hypothetical protein [Nostoc commune]|nr:hypothetical protein [Nostoc commune]
MPAGLKTQQVIADNRSNEVKMGDRIRIKVEGLSAATRKATPNATNS